MQCSSTSGDRSEGTESAQPPADPGLLKNQISGSTYTWLPPDHHHALEQMPDLVHGHGSNDGEIDPDADIADPVPSHHQLLNQQDNLVRFFDSTYDPFLQPGELGAGHPANPPARLNETFTHGDIRSPKLHSSANHHTSWNSYQFPNQPASGLLQQGSPSPRHPKEGVIQAQTRIMDDPCAFQSDPLHSPDVNPSDNTNNYQYMFQSESPDVPLDLRWPGDFTIPATQAADWDSFPLAPDGLDGNASILGSEDFQSSGIQDQANITPVEGVETPNTIPIIQQLLPEPMQNVQQVDNAQYQDGSEQESTFKEEPIDTFYFSSPVSNDNHSIGEKQQFEEDESYLRFSDSTTDFQPPSLVQVAQAAPIHNISQGTPSTQVITRPRAGSAPSKRGRWRGTPNLPPLITESKKPELDGTDDAIDQTPKTSPLQIVQEDGQGGSISGSAYRLSAAARARRMGPLSNAGRRDAALRRKHKNVCVWCRLAKKKCSGDSPCTTCLKTMILEQPCVKADFFQIVESGTSQRAVNHLTLDGSTRVRMELPSTFDMSQLISLLDERRGRFNIRATQSWGPLYVLDMDETYKFLRDMNKGEVNSRHDLGDFIDNRILKTNKWLRCVKECDPMGNLFALLSQWNNMPSRASYEFVSTTDGAPNRPMNIQDPADQTEIILAAQLSRIFCRKLEVDGYKSLQNVLSNHRWDEFTGESLTRFVSQLGQILLTLRWRASWWEVLGDGRIRTSSSSPPTPSPSSSTSTSNPLPPPTPSTNPGHERYEYRVQNLCKILYVYYTSIRLKLPSWAGPDTVPEGVWSMYADAAPVWDDFPSVPTAEGFESWMERGKELIREAGVEGRIAKF
ncbi:hypothetical protein FQN54_000255 [Arachnomyces sp. PD_36]|nr:hypothetical protein FQN54_000255 [Arachnomyces sp. PD_36]